MMKSAKYNIAFTAAIGLFMTLLDTTIVNVALTPIAAELKSNVGAVQWIVTAYFLANAVVIPVAGYLGSRYGIKLLYQICLTLFVVGSLLCALSPNLPILITSRVVQGLGSGALFTLGTALAYEAFPMEERASAGAIVGVPVLLAPIFGPTFGGFLCDNLGWQYIFAINLPIGIVALILGHYVFPADKVRQPTVGSSRSKFDYIGSILSTLAVLTVICGSALVAVTKPDSQTALNPVGEINGWGYGPVWILLGVGLLLLILFAIYELHFSPDPVLDIKLFKKRNFALPVIILWFVAVVIYGELILLPIFFQQIRLPLLSAFDTGLILLPQMVAAAVIIALSAKLYYWLGARNIALLALTLMLISFWQLAQINSNTDGFAVIPWLAILGTGFGIIFVPMQTLALEAFTGPVLAKATSLLNISRTLISSAGISSVIVIFVNQNSQHLSVLRSSSATEAVGANRQIVAQAGTAGMNDAFVAIAIMTAVAIAVAFALPGRASKTSQVKATPGEVGNELAPVTLVSGGTPASNSDV